MSKFLILPLIFSLFFANVLEAITAAEIFAKKDKLTIGIISAVPGEIGRLLEYMETNTIDSRNRHEELS